jgi:heme exporter protein CcmD
MNAIAALSEYGAYVWTAYGICALLLVAEMIAVRARLRRSERMHEVGAEGGVR